MFIIFQLFLSKPTVFSNNKVSHFDFEITRVDCISNYLERLIVTLSILLIKTYFLANSIEPDEATHGCLSFVGRLRNTLSATTVMSKIKYRRVYFRNSGVEGLI